MGESVGTLLDGEKYVNLETFKKDGNGVKTPVWAAPLEGGLVVFTAGDSFKVKRLRNNAKCRIAACDMRGNVKGPWFDAQGRIVEDAAEEKRGHAALRQKYGWQMAVGDFFATLTGRKGKRKFLVIRVGDRAAG
jgi:PPOX class probable F420-dependent enzyme